MIFQYLLHYLFICVIIVKKKKKKIISLFISVLFQYLFILLPL